MNLPAACPAIGWSETYGVDGVANATLLSTCWCCFSAHTRMLRLSPAGLCADCQDDLRNP